jgi:hypothetical protein
VPFSDVLISRTCEPAWVAWRRRSGQLAERSVGVGHTLRDEKGERMATKVTKTLIDDLDGAEASETVRFTIGGKSYEIDLSAKNAEQLDKLLEPYKARRAGGRASVRLKARASRAPGAAPTGAAKGKTLFSGLNAEQKDAFRRWAKMPNARRISDERVQAWIDAGRPIDGRAPGRKASVKRTVARKKTATRKAGAAKR